MSTITVATQNAYAVSGETVATGIIADPDSIDVAAGAVVQMQPGNDYLIPARADVALFMRNKSGEAVDFTVNGGQRIDGARLKTLVLELASDGGASVHGALMDPAYGQVVGRPTGKARCNVSAGPIDLLCVSLRPGFSM